jgi:hypothetical protein
MTLFLEVKSTRSSDLTSQEGTFSFLPTAHPLKTSRAYILHRCIVSHLEHQPVDVDNVPQVHVYRDSVVTRLVCRLYSPVQHRWHLSCFQMYSIRKHARILSLPRVANPPWVHAPLVPASLGIWYRCKRFPRVWRIGGPNHPDSRETLARRHDSQSLGSVRISQKPCAQTVEANKLRPKLCSQIRSFYGQYQAFFVHQNWHFHTGK